MLAVRPTVACHTELKLGWSTIIGRHGVGVGSKKNAVQTWIIIISQCCIQKMWLGGQTESFQNVGGAKVYTMY